MTLSALIRRNWISQTSNQHCLRSLSTCHTSIARPEIGQKRALSRLQSTHNPSTRAKPNSAVRLCLQESLYEKSNPYRLTGHIHQCTYITPLSTSHSIFRLQPRRSLATLQHGRAAASTTSSIDLDSSSSGTSLEYTRPFTNLKNLQPSTLSAIQSTFGHEYMSKVQSSVLSTLPTSRDLLVKAKTGTGKTLAFLVAALESLVALPDIESIKMKGKIGCVIIAPTRELALQISEEAQMLLGPLGWGVQHLVGGYGKGSQLDRISKEPAEFIVATPGRMKDLLGNSEFAAKIKESKILVLDEADTILQLGFRKELDTILETMPKDRQTFLFSATVDSKMDSLLEVALHKRSKERQGPIIIDTVGSKDINLNLATRQGYCFAPLPRPMSLLFVVSSTTTF
ncbi:MAG: P-loop containing nucleoside triphosphate hydrolase protein [Linnemannia elongata]|nr:MAG: P-loop containing nucleoside triphosphate hydrolase protein [Linnemannia elongata]